MKEVIKKCEEKMTKTCENLDGEFANIRAGRANPNLLNRIMVEYYGVPTPLPKPKGRKSMCWMGESR